MFTYTILAGFIKMAHATSKMRIQPGTLFSYYKNPYFKDLVLACGIDNDCYYVTITVFREINMEFIGGLLNLVINFFYQFSLFSFVIFGNLNAIEAIKAFTVIKQPVVILVQL
jgi:hypothetical protein